MDNFQKYKEKVENCKSNLYPYQCEKCELLFTSEKQLSIHQKKCGQFACEKCEKVYTFEGVLERHINALNREKKICTITIITKNALFKKNVFSPT